MNRLALERSYITESLGPYTAYYSSEVFYCIYCVVMDSGNICMCGDNKIVDPECKKISFRFQ